MVGCCERGCVEFSGLIKYMELLISLEGMLCKKEYATWV
jgi:hypothetical protein